MSKTPSTVFKTFLYAPRNFGIALATIMLLTAAGNALAAPAPKITSSKTATGQVGVAFSYQVTADQAIPSGGWGTTVSIPGVNFSTATGAFSGTPTTAGTFSGNITATNANGTGSKTLAVTIAPPPHTFPTAIATSSPPAVYAGDTITLDASGSDTNPPGGTLTYVWQQIAP